MPHVGRLSPKQAKALLHPSERVLTWTRTSTGEKTESVNYSIRDEGKGFLSLTLRFTRKRDHESEQVEEPILLIPSMPNFGGIRYWFKYPTIRNGKSCPHKVAKLHLPPGYRYFACRHCNGLTYASRQEHNKRMDVFARMSKDAL